MNTCAPLESISVSALGGSASIANSGYGPDGSEWDGWEHVGNPQEHESGDPPPEGEWPPDSHWRGLYFPFLFEISAAGNSDNTQYWLWVRDEYGFFDVPHVPTGANEVTSLSIPVSCTVTGLRLCKKRTHASYPGVRTSPLDFSDSTAYHTWYSEVGAQVVVTGGGLSVSGDFAGGVPGEYDMGAGFNFVGIIANNLFSAALTSYGRISSITCFGQSLSMGSIVLYNPGTGDAPSAAYPDWKRAAPTSGDYLLLKDDSGVALQRSASSTSGGSGGFTATAPITLNYKGDFARAFDPDSASLSTLKVRSEPRSWVDGAWVQDLWDFGSDYSKTEFPVTWLFTYEYDFIDSTATAYVTQASRVTAGEDVGGSDITLNDAQLGFVCQPLTAGVTGNPIWGPFLTITQATSVNVNDPAGAPTRPSPWVGSTNVAVTGDVWTVGATSTPTVTRTLLNRYELRMARLAGGYTPGLQYSTEWPFVMKALNSPAEYAALGDDPAWDNTVPYEDIWNWANYGYLALAITAPVAGTVTITVTYRVPTLSDPCYTSTQRWNEFTVSYVTRTAVYTVSVQAGVNTKLIDLCKPTSGTVPCGEHRLHVVTGVQFALPAGVGAWTLTTLALTRDTAHTPSRWHHNKRAWDWTSCWFGLGAFADGKPCWQMDHGYRRYREELLGLQYIQFRQHDPDSSATDDLSYAEALSRIYTKVNWQEGFTATWLDPVNAAGNKDADGICFAPTMYWWDLQHQQESSLSGAVCVGKYYAVYGAVHDVYYTAFPRGKVCGLAYSGGRRKRSSGTVWLYKCATAAGDYTRVGSYVPDVQGFWRSDPMLEKNWFYGVAGRDLGATVLAADLQTSGWQVANREYTYAGRVNVPQTGDAVAMTKHPAGLVKYAAGLVNGSIIVYRLDDAATRTWVALPTVDTSGDYDSVGVEHDGAELTVTARHADTQAIWQWYARAEGEPFAELNGTTWEAKPGWVGPTAV